jgi:hypothetical protein
MSLAIYLGGGGAAAAKAAALPGLGKPVSEAELALQEMSIGPGPERADEGYLSDFLYSR